MFSLYELEGLRVKGFRVRTFTSLWVVLFDDPRIHGPDPGVFWESSVSSLVLKLKITATLLRSSSYPSFSFYFLKFVETTFSDSLHVHFSPPTLCVFRFHYSVTVTSTPSLVRSFLLPQDTSRFHPFTHGLWSIRPEGDRPTREEPLSSLTE